MTGRPPRSTLFPYPPLSRPPRPRHEQLAPALVHPGAARLVAREGAGDQRAGREVDVGLRRVVRPGDQHAVLVGDQHPRRAQQSTVLLGLIEHVAPLGSLEQPLPELRHLGAHGAHPRKRRGPTSEERPHAPPHPPPRPADPFLRPAVRPPPGEPPRPTPPPPAP